MMKTLQGGYWRESFPCCCPVLFMRPMSVLSVTKNFRPARSKIGKSANMPKMTFPVQPATERHTKTTKTISWRFYPMKKCVRAAMRNSSPIFPMASTILAGPA